MTVLQAQPAVATPELNQLVRVRGRHWVVSEILRGSLDADVLGDTHQVQHLVELTSVEDDGLGEELKVIWEVEPDAAILQKETLPIPHAGRFDDPARLDAFLDAVRWGAITSADSQALQAPFRSGITIEDYQLDPVVRALSMPRVNLLIADDVGLGKTIEAGLVVQEMVLRHRVRTVMVVCPASLCLKWRAEMAEKFGLEFRIVDAELVRQLRRERGLAANPWTHFPRLIVSMDWLKRPRAMSLFRDVLPAEPTYPRAFDLLLIDEVHNVAPTGGGRYATDSQRTKAIRGSRRTSSTTSISLARLTTGTANPGRPCSNSSIPSASPVGPPPPKRRSDERWFAASSRTSAWTPLWRTPTARRAFPSAGSSSLRSPIRTTNAECTDSCGSTPSPGCPPREGQGGPSSSGLRHAALEKAALLLACRLRRDPWRPPPHARLDKVERRRISDYCRRHSTGSRMTSTTRRSTTRQSRRRSPLRPRRAAPSTTPSVELLQGMVSLGRGVAREARRQGDRGCSSSSTTRARMAGPTGGAPGTTSGSSSSPSTATPSSTSTNSLPTASREGDAACALLHGGMDTEDRERIKAEFQADPEPQAAADPPRDRRRLRGH